MWRFSDMVQGYGVRFAQHDEMPPGCDWLFLTVDDHLHLVLREGSATPRVLNDAWAAYREISARQLV